MLQQPPKPSAPKIWVWDELEMRLLKVLSRDGGTEKFTGLEEATAVVSLGAPC